MEYAIKSNCLTPAARQKQSLTNVGQTEANIETREA